jgi:hypothetical protein
LIVFIHVVLMQPMKEDPPLDSKCKDKFLIQVVAVSNEEAKKPISDVVIMNVFV